MNTVHHKFFEKKIFKKNKNQINFDKILEKIKFSKNKIFENKILLKTIF